MAIRKGGFPPGKSKAYNRHATLDMKTSVNIVQGDITVRAVDAIVNAANRTLLGGGGVDGAIHRAAGPELLEECRTLGGCEAGQAKATKAYRMQQAKCLIHTVGPVFGSENGREAELLANCYRSCLALAIDQGCKSIAFPSISTGAFGYPVESASRVALETIRDFLGHHQGNLDVVEIVTFSHRDFETYLRTHRSVFAGAGGL
jgi:O-acetyl-ADP-ribose deacetylase